jgi:ABC-2 type transport system permease protein
VWLSLLLLFVGPCGLALLIRRFDGLDDLEDTWAFYHAIIQMLTFNVVIPLSCILYGTALIGSEVEARTAVYLFTRRMRRATVLLVKFAAASLAMVVLVELAVLAQYACTVGGLDLASLDGAAQGQWWKPAEDLIYYLTIAPMGVLAFGAVFVAISLLTARPLAASILYFVIVELVVSNLPLGARIYSVSHQLRRYMFAKIPQMGDFHDLSAEQVQMFFPPGSNGMVTLCALILAVLALACTLITVRELVPAKIAHE